MRRVRPLTVADTPAIRRFLEGRPDTTMFLRANLADNGLPVPGRPHASVWIGVEDGADIVGVVVHDGSDRVVPEAVEGLDEAVRAAVAESGRPVAGIIGPHAQVVAARAALGRVDAPAQLDTREILYSLELSSLVVPDALRDGAVTCRRATLDDLDTVLVWRAAYEVETVNATETPALAAARRLRFERVIGDGHLWVLRDGDALVSMTAFNAVLPDCVQVGSVFTPPELRSRGYARCVVAGSLRDARAEGVQRSVLFTGDDNVAGQRAYEALGYRAVGDYGLLLFEDAG